MYMYMCLYISWYMTMYYQDLNCYLYVDSLHKGKFYKYTSCPVQDQLLACILGNQLNSWASECLMQEL